jgi:hypothetical protein
MGFFDKKTDEEKREEARLKKQRQRAELKERYGDEEYKKMMTIEGEKFNEFLKKCVPTKKGDDKSKFKSCLEDYKKNK